MEILFVGGVFTPENQDEIFKKSKSNIQYAANSLQWNLIEGLDICNEKPVHIVNAVFVGSYPSHYKDWYIKSSSWSHRETSKDENIGFLNIFGMKHIWRAAALAVKVYQWIKSTTDKKRAIVIYSMHTPFLLAAAVAKKMDKSIKTCLIVPDLPEYMNLGQKKNRFVSVLKKLDRWFMNKVLKSIDSFVLLTKYMAKALNICSKPWIVAEGMVSIHHPARYVKLKTCVIADQKIILYTGTLNKSYGILELLEAFTMIPYPQYKLWICGEGEARKEVMDYAFKDVRIRYFGQVNPNEVSKLQREASILINPRGNEGEFTRFSFPSKLMEYLVSGTPALIRRLPGIPKEYEDYFFMIEDNGPYKMAEKIIEVLSMPGDELAAFGEKAKSFVLHEKNNVKQARRILDLINQENK